jgi:hypothetical protein
MNVFNGWYTDTVSVFRVLDVTVGHISKQQRTKIGEYPCRIYRSKKGSPTMTDREARLRSDDIMAVELGRDIKSGDELLIVRGGQLGQTESQRYFAGDVMPYYEPVGGAFNGLAHIEVGLLQEEVIDNAYTPEPEPEPTPDPEPEPEETEP